MVGEKRAPPHPQTSTCSGCVSVLSLHVMLQSQERLVVNARWSLLRGPRDPPFAFNVRMVCATNLNLLFVG
jgi:hypothetical protein